MRTAILRSRGLGKEEFSCDTVSVPSNPIWSELFWGASVVSEG